MNDALVLKHLTSRCASDQGRGNVDFFKKFTKVKFYLKVDVNSVMFIYVYIYIKYSY